MTSAMTISRRAVAMALTASAVGVMMKAPAHASTIIKGTLIGKDGWLYLVWDEPFKAKIQEVREVTNLIKITCSLLKSVGIETVILIVPSKSRIYRDYLPDDITYTKDAELLYDNAIQELSESDAILPDLSNLFLQIRKSEPQRQLWFKTDHHWTPSAGDAAANEVAKKILEKVHLPHSIKPGIKFGKTITETKYKSDLSSVLPVEERAAYPNETYQVRRPLGWRDGGLTLHEGAADIAIVGNSLMQAAYNFPTALSNQLDRPVSLFSRIHPVGPYMTMLQYLADPKFNLIRPKVIVWCFHEIDVAININDDSVWQKPILTNSEYLEKLRSLILR